MFVILLLYQITFTSAFCTDVALWVPWKDETVDMAANALHLKNYDKFIELNPDINPDSVQRGKPYTVPFTNVDPPATWVKANGCTPLLVLDADASTASVRQTSHIQKTSTSSTLETRRQTTTETYGEQTSPTVSTIKGRMSPRTSRTESKPNTKVTSGSPMSGTSSRSNFHTSTQLDTSKPDGYSSTASSSSLRSSSTGVAANTLTISFKSTTLTSSNAYTTQTKGFSSELNSHVSHTPYLSGSQTKAQTKTITMATTELTTMSVTQTIIKTETTTVTTGANAFTTSSIVCHPDGSQGPSGTHNTDEKTLEKYATKFCADIEGVSLTEDFQSVQLVYGQSTALYIFTVSWIPYCKGDEQSVTGAENLCYNTIMEDWRGCNNKGQGGYRTKGCIMWIYRPGAIEGTGE